MATEYIDMTPECLKTPEGRARVDKANQEWIAATFAYANHAERVIADFPEVDDDDMKLLQTLKSERADKQDAFLKSFMSR